MRRKRLIMGLVTALCIGVVLCIAFTVDLFHGWELRGTDLLFRVSDFTQDVQSKEKVILVAIDDQSLEQLGLFSSWPRSYHAQMIKMLSDAKAKVIVFDLLFSETAATDEELAASIRNAGNVVLPLTGTRIKQSFRGGGSIEYEDILRPTKALEESALALGHANVLPDEDGVVRRLPVLIRTAVKDEVALSLVAATKYRQSPQVGVPTSKDKQLSFEGRLIPVDDLNCMTINYKDSLSKGDSSAGTYTVSYVDVLKGKIESTLFKDSLVIVGVTAIGMGDKFWTPLGGMVSGVEVHTNAIRTIISGNFLMPVPSVVTILLILLVSLLCGLAVLRLRVLWAVLSAIFLIILNFILALSLFDKNIMPSVVYPPSAVLCTFVGVTLYRVNSEQSEKREIIKVFGRYVQPQVVRRILAALDKGELNLGGELHEVTVLFADVRGFTSLAEVMPPEELVRALNSYFSVVIKAVLKYDGMINKFGGDSIMAVWNVPTEYEDHALRATKAAIDAQRAISELQQKSVALPQMNFGIGITTGKAVAGNMGSEDRLEYSVIGDTVNLAWRLTSLTPAGKVWINSGAFELVRDCVVVKQIEPLTVKGKSRPIVAYEVIDYLPEVDRGGKA